VRPDEREVAGLTCGQVMAVLSDVIDGGIAPAVAVQVEAHVAGCGQCARFGQQFVALLTTMREQLARPDEVPADVLARVRAALPR
jgi:predicted anti-sigma-YlaC factor YlaD